MEGIHKESVTFGIILLCCLRQSLANRIESNQLLHHLTEANRKQVCMKSELLFKDIKLVSWVSGHRKSSQIDRFIAPKIKK